MNEEKETHILTLLLLYLLVQSQLLAKSNLSGFSEGVPDGGLASFIAHERHVDFSQRVSKVAAFSA